MVSKPIPSYLPSTNHQRAIIIDFMAYARKVPIKKQNLKTYNDFFTCLWKTFISLSETCNRVDIVFDVYNEQSIKGSERRRRTKVEGIETIITGFDQPLPVELDRFWPKNKIALQQLFTQWTLKNVESENFEKLLFLGWSHKEGDTMCYSLIIGFVTEEGLLECTHEEAYGRIFFHANHAIKVGRYSSVVIASPDTDIFVAATHHFNKQNYFNLEELWFVSGRSDSRSVFPIHDFANDLDPDLAEILPAIHAFTGCDTASKVGTKSKAVKEGANIGYEVLYSFGSDELSEEMIADAEKFLLKCITNHDVDTFNQLRFIVYHEKHLQFDIERFPPTSDSIRQHILRAYLQCYIWLHAPSLENIELNPLDYGYKLDDNGNLVPILATKPPIPSNFPQPCNYRLKDISCYQYCKCNASPECKNPLK